MCNSTMSYIAWLRSKIGPQKTILTFATVVLRDAQGRILLQRRGDIDIWGLPGGILEPGESLQECARRELLEETGLAAEELGLVGIYTEPRYDTTYPNGDQVQQFTVCFQGQRAGGRLQIDGQETRALAFYEADQLPWQEMPDFYIDMARDTLRGGEPVFSPPQRRAELVDQITAIRARIGPALYIGAGSVAVVVDQARRILMVKRVDNGEWSLPGGYTHLGENAAHTAVREVLEETGLHIAIERLLGISSQVQPWVYPNGDRTQNIVSVFRAHPLDRELIPDQTETSQVGWMEPEEVLVLDTHPNLRRLNQAAVQHLEHGYFLI